MKRYLLYKATDDNILYEYSIIDTINGVNAMWGETPITDFSDRNIYYIPKILDSDTLEELESIFQDYVGYTSTLYYIGEADDPNDLYSLYPEEFI